MARILILTPQLPYPPEALTGLSQGTTIRNFNLIAGLARSHTLDLVTFHAPDLDVHTSQSGPTLLRQYCRQVITAPPPTRTTTHRARDTVLSSLPDMALRLESPEMHGHMARLLREGSYDVLQVEGIEMAPYAMQAGTQRPLFVFDDHNAEYLLQRRAFLTDIRQVRRWAGAAYSLVQWQKLATYERRVCRTADHVVTVSQADRAALNDLAPDLQATVIPNGVDLQFYRPGVVEPLPGMNPNALVFTGKMDYRPNVDAVLWFAQEVLPQILRRLPDVHFYVVGQQPHSRLGTLAGDPAITLTGRVPDVRPYIAGAAVYVVPLRIGGGTRLKILEAMAMGQAIVSTRLGSDGFPFQDGKGIRFADEATAFAETVAALLVDRAQAQRLGRQARAIVEADFSWDAIVPRMEALYQ